MAKWIATSFLGLMLTASANAELQEINATLGCVDCFNFVAPSVNDATTVSPAEYGLIVLDSSDGSFKGNTANGWRQLSQRYEAVAGGANTTIDFQDNGDNIRINPTISDYELTLNTSYPQGHIITVKNASGTNKIIVKSNNGSSITVVYPDASLQFYPNVNSAADDTDWEVIGTVTSDWEDRGAPTLGYSSGGSQGSTSTNKLYTKRVGDTLYVHVEYAQTSAGTNGSGALLLTLPDSLSVDTAKMAVSADRRLSHVGSGWYMQGSTQRNISVKAETTTQLNFTYNSSSANTDADVTGFFSSSSARLSFTAAVPISGWSNSKGI